MSTTAPNPTRTCIGCTQTDDHPRHVIALPSGDEVTWHMDCHVIATGCGPCKGTTAGAEDLRGDDLRGHLVTLAPTVTEG